MCPWWNPDSYVIITSVGDTTAVVYRVRPEKGGREQTIHRNDLKLCVAPAMDSPAPAAERPRPDPPVPLYYGFPAMQRARRSARTNFGQPPNRYGH